MAYDETKLTRLAALKALAEKVETDYATKTEVNEVKEKVTTLENVGGQPNVIEKISVNGTAQTVTSKTVNIKVPTKVSEITNDSGFQTSTQVNTAISTAISKTKHASFKEVDSVPEASAAEENILYLMMNPTTNHYDIYAKVGTEVVLLDDTTVDLSGYVQKVSGKGLSTNDYTTDEKNKLAGIAANANNYTHPAYTAKSSGLYKITVDATGHVSAVTAVAKADITALGIPSTNTTYSAMKAATASAAGAMGLVPAPAAGKQTSFLRGDGTWVVPTNTTYSPATASANGLMSSADKTKLDGMIIATDAEVTEMINAVFA